MTVVSLVVGAVGEVGETFWLAREAHPVQSLSPITPIANSCALKGKASPGIFIFAGSNNVVDCTVAPLVRLTPFVVYPSGLVFGLAPASVISFAVDICTTLIGVCVDAVIVPSPFGFGAT